MATRSKAKALVRAENKDRRPKAIAKYIRISPSKVHVVLHSRKRLQRSGCNPQDNGKSRYGTGT